MNKTLFFCLFFVFSVSNIFSFDNKNLDHAFNLLSDATDMILDKKESCFKNFSEYKTKWFNKEDFVIVLDKTGKCLVNENVLKQNNFIVNGKALKYGDFCNWVIKEINLTNNMEGIIYYLSYCSSIFNLEMKAFLYKKVFISNDKCYIVATIKDQIFLEKALVEKELNLYSDILKNKNFASFPILRLKSDTFFGNKNFFFILNNNGDIIFSTAKEDFSDFLKGKKTINYKDVTNKFYMKNLLNQSNMQLHGSLSYFFAEDNNKYAYTRHIFFQKILINKEKFLICYNVKFPKASYINIDKSQDNAIRTQFLSRKILENIEEFGYLEFKNNYLNKNIPVLNDIPFFIVDGDTQNILFDTTDPGHKNKKNIQFIKNIQGKYIWKNMKLVLDNNKEKGWICLSVLNKQDEFSLIKRGEEFFVYIARISLNKKTYIIGVPSNLKKIKKEFIEENSEIMKNLFINEFLNNTNILDIRNLLLDIMINNTRFFIIDISGNLVIDSQIVYQNLINNVMKSKDIKGNYFFRKVLMDLKTKDKTWESFDIKTLEGEIKEKFFYCNKIEMEDKRYVIVIESDLNI